MSESSGGLATSPPVLRRMHGSGHRNRLQASRLGWSCMETCMSSSIVPILTGIRRRQRLVSTIRGAAYGLLASAVIAVALGVQRIVGQAGLSPMATIEALLAGPILGAVAGMILSRP